MGTVRVAFAKDMDPPKSIHFTYPDSPHTLRVYGGGGGGGGGGVHVCARVRACVCVSCGGRVLYSVSSEMVVWIVSFAFRALKPALGCLLNRPDSKVMQFLVISSDESHPRCAQR